MASFVGLFERMPNADAYSVEQIGVFAAILSQLSEANKTMNLTAVTDAATAVLVHFADSLALLDALKLDDGDLNAHVAADVGAGAGFPSLPCAVVMPECDWYAVESIGKKSRFTQACADAVGLRNVHALNLRAEELGRVAAGDGRCGRESCDIVTARALSSIPTLLEICLPLVKVGGILLLFKTAHTAPEELALIEPLSALLGGTREADYCYSLPGDQHQRLILRIRKTGQCPEKYPRVNGIPFKKPLDVSNKRALK